MGSLNPSQKFLLSSAAVGVLLCLILMAMRVSSVVSFSEPIHLQTSGAEYESLYAIWREVQGLAVYTDRYQAYDSLMFCGYRHLAINHKKRFATGKVYINGLEGFWSWAKERLIKHHGISPLWFPFYLKDPEFRYNHRFDDMFDLAAGAICSLIPTPGNSFPNNGE